MWLFVLLIVVPILEIALFIEVGGLIGLWPTIGIVVVTAIAGAALLRREGFATLAELQSRLDRGGDPTGPMAHGALILVAGVVLLTPGFFTDAVGFSLLVPGVRRAVIRYLAKRVTVIALNRARGGRHPGGPGEPPPASGQTVEGQWEEIDPEEARQRRAGNRRP